MLVPAVPILSHRGVLVEEVFKLANAA